MPRFNTKRAKEELWKLFRKDPLRENVYTIWSDCTNKETLLDLCYDSTFLRECMKHAEKLYYLCKESCGDARDIGTKWMRIERQLKKKIGDPINKEYLPKSFKDGTWDAFKTLYREREQKRPKLADLCEYIAGGELEQIVKKMLTKCVYLLMLTDTLKDDLEDLIEYLKQIKDLEEVDESLLKKVHKGLGCTYCILNSLGSVSDEIYEAQYDLLVIERLMLEYAQQKGLNKLTDAWKGGKKLEPHSRDCLLVVSPDFGNPMMSEFADEKQADKALATRMETRKEVAENLMEIIGWVAEAAKLIEETGVNVGTINVVGFKRVVKKRIHTPESNDYPNMFG